ncbi:DNA polymerase III subunit epsilon [Phyllobacterium phragmitis]|uniref:DNA-directed DNA polymerase n=1 Tax=Phyllobacterium phragmitis TaxID=2670329 RepID=A0A2S9IJH2_9HYPH|nr:exonuclease domain-containing protein [Phyllobacterium phragmitis]PRD40659.1 DNA polymerase III subunit epsilon [Phyllobacterium phragmitis]
MPDNIYKPAAHTRLRRIIVLDTETTGLLPYDRIVTLGAMRIEGDELQRQSLYLVFDPRKDSHPGALAVHGYDDWMTRFQDLFADLAPKIHRWLSWADELVMHNAEFDMRYVQRELRKADVEQLAQPTFCTMERARNVWRGESAKLDHCLKRIGLSRRERLHGALEDAYLTAGLYLHQIGSSGRLPPVNDWPNPKNLRAVPPRPAGVLPRRTPKRRSV